MLALLTSRLLLSRFEQEDLGKAWNDDEPTKTLLIYYLISMLIGNIPFFLF